MKRWNGPDKPVSVRLPEDLHTAVKSAAPLRHRTVEAAYEEALTVWVDRGPAAAPDSLAAALAAAVERQGEEGKPENGRWHDLLEQILEHGSEADVIGIQQNLKWGAEAVSNQGPDSSRKTG
jgi:hypothetical protein